MKQFFVAACVAACVMYFTPVSVSAQVTEHDDFFEIDSLETDDFVEVNYSTENGDVLSGTVTFGDKKNEPLTAVEKARIKKYTADGYTFVDEDEEGGIILKRDKKFICINPRMSNELIVRDADKCEFVDISGCGMSYGVAAQTAGKTTVFTQKGAVLLPTTTGEVVDVIVNPFKNSEHTPYAYAIFKDNGDYYAVLSNGSRYELKMDACMISVMSIFGIRDNKVYCFTPEGMEAPEYLFDVNDTDVEYDEGEMLSVVGKGRFDYLGMRKYSNIIPAVLLKKGNEYFVYPGGKKVIIKKATDVESIKVSETQTAVFTGFPTSGPALVDCIKENSF